MTQYIDYAGDVIQCTYLGHGCVTYYVASLDADFETVRDAQAAIDGMNALEEPIGGPDVEDNT